MDKPRKKKLVKIEFGKKPKPLLFKFLLFISVVTLILLIFYLFSQANFTPNP